MMPCGARSPSSRSSNPSGKLARRDSSRSHQAVNGFAVFLTFFHSGSRSRMTSRTSPTMGTSASRILPISAGSMSTWMTLAFGANSLTLPVTRSSKRAPRTMRRSLSCSPRTAGTEPCMPGIPRFCGCLSDNTPRAVSVVIAGAPTASTISRSSFWEFARIAPPPI
ncbi:unannotated protein [freshwater metagenome]|uniref:Unannotated protein n=1 Tax=freshwater metagenome TaxID=449393 RepID=A0A6J6F9L3_9ZZZZ